RSATAPLGCRGGCEARRSPHGAFAVPRPCSGSAPPDLRTRPRSPRPPMLVPIRTRDEVAHVGVDDSRPRRVPAALLLEHDPLLQLCVDWHAPAGLRNDPHDLSAATAARRHRRSLLPPRSPFSNEARSPHTIAVAAAASPRTAQARCRSPDTAS